MGPFEALIILAVVLLLFGPKNLPKLGRIFGQGIHKIRESVDDDEDDDGPTVHPPVSDNGRIEVSDSDIEVGDVRYCPKCGAEVDGGWHFCGRCGAKLESEDNVD